MGMFERDVVGRLTRIESKLVRGFEELGVNISTDADWLSVDDTQRIVFVATLGRSMSVILTDMQRKGATQVGKLYDIVHKGSVVGTIVYKPLV